MARTAKTTKATKAVAAKKTSRKKTPLKKKGGPDPIDVHVGGRVRLRRMVLGMSQDALGKALGLTFQQVQKYEKGANRIGAGRLKQLSGLLEVPIQFFYDDYETEIGAQGFAEYGAEDSFMDFLHSQEGVQLCRYYMEIEEPIVRKRVLDLVRSISEAETAKKS